MKSGILFCLGLSFFLFHGEGYASQPAKAAGCPKMAGVWRRAETCPQEFFSDKKVIEQLGCETVKVNDQIFDFTRTKLKYSPGDQNKEESLQFDIAQWGGPGWGSGFERIHVQNQKRPAPEHSGYSGVAREVYILEGSDLTVKFEFVAGPGEGLRASCKYVLE